MSATNDGLRTALRGPWPAGVVDNILLGSGTTQAAAQVVMRGGANRVVASGGAGASCLLPALGNSDEGADIIYVMNDSANAIALFCSPGDTLNGSSNGSISIAAGAFAHCLARPPSAGMFYQGSNVTAPDWRVAVQT